MRKFLPILISLILFTSVNAQTSGKLTFNITTASTEMGYYAPTNVEAIWVEDNTGKFVKTLLKYAASRAGYLDLWNSSSKANTVDAKTGATRNSHEPLTCEWNGKDVTGNVVTDGIYKVRIQLTDGNFSGVNTTYTFTKGTSIVNLNPEDVLPSFKNVVINWLPTNTAIDDVKLDDIYAVYPNPTTSGIYINGAGVTEVQIFTLLGKKLVSAENQYIDLSKLPNGYYIAKIYTVKGNLVKKIEKR